MNFRKGTTFVLMGLRLKLNNIRSKSNGTRSPLKNLELIKTESGLRNVRRPLIIEQSSVVSKQRR